MSCLFEITVSEHEITAHSTIELCAHTGVTVLRPICLPDLPRHDNPLGKKLGEVGVALVMAIFLDGVTSMELSPYYLRVKSGKLFNPDPVHITLEGFILQNWPQAQITGDRYEAAEACIGFVITSGPAREDILRVLDGSHPDWDPNGWEALAFRGHRPSIDFEETLTMHLSYAVGRRDMGDPTARPPRPAPIQGQRIVWDIYPGFALAIGPEPTKEQMRRAFWHPDAQLVHNAFVRYNDATGQGLVLDQE